MLDNFINEIIKHFFVWRLQMHTTNKEHKALLVSTFAQLNKMNFATAAQVDNIQADIDAFLQSKKLLVKPKSKSKTKPTKKVSSIELEAIQFQSQVIGKWARVNVGNGSLVRLRDTVGIFYVVKKVSDDSLFVMKTVRGNVKEGYVVDTKSIGLNILFEHIIKVWVNGKWTDAYKLANQV